ncbi:hypothetical protein [Pelagibius sp. Alg239-R121]|uniref:hypothetical protein n=1 Tax=Pelagibius sp. Alg239-R121 TaxID=2993448 RepID=UPI0024A744C7|nr:hypothetical protein [Pelagibius sp. Alg239-R121]
MGIQEYVALATLIALLFGGLTKIRVTLFRWLNKIDIGSPEKNTRLRLVVGSLFFGNLGLTALILFVFLVIGFGFDRIQDELFSDDRSQKIEIVDASSLKIKTPYLGVVIEKSSNQDPSTFPVLNLNQDIVDPVKKALIAIFAFFTVASFLLFVIVGLIKYILNPSPAPPPELGP